MSTEYRSEKLIKEIEAELEENEYGVSDCLWIICCGVFAVICVLPKYNKKQKLQTQLQVELSKPIRPREEYIATKEMAQ